ncbi:hypothetical protein HDU92_004049 [Lobulomyces angularis]|nr:hypothetical protein HDU92_004049 [Lobulomyces angularis]
MDSKMFVEGVSYITITEDNFITISSLRRCTKNLLVFETVADKMYMEESYKFTIVRNNVKEIKNYGILGILDLMFGKKILVFISERTFVCNFGEVNIYKVKNISTIPILMKSHLTLDEEDFEKRSLEAIYAVFKNEDVYFSLKEDLSNTQQRLFKINKNCSMNIVEGQFNNMDTRFVWNMHLLKPLLKFKCYNFIIPTICGFVGKKMDFYSQISFCVISRANRFSSKKFFRKNGVNKYGTCAIEVETELVMRFKNFVSGFVQTRGAVPLNWNERMLEDKFFQGSRLILDDALNKTSITSCMHHFQELNRKYGKVLVVDLLKNYGDEKLLSEAYYAAILKTNLAFVSYTSYRSINDDFAIESLCNRLPHSVNANLKQVKSLILPSVYRPKLNLWDSALVSHGYFLLNLKKKNSNYNNFVDGPEKLQDGINRVSCLTCCDETNIAQFHFALKVIKKIIVEEVGLSNKKTNYMSNIEKLISELFAHNGNSISKLFTGTKSKSSCEILKKYFSLIRNPIEKISVELGRTYLRVLQENYRNENLSIFHGEFCRSKNDFELISHYTRKLRVHQLHTQQALAVRLFCFFKYFLAPKKVQGVVRFHVSMCWLIALAIIKKSCTVKDENLISLIQSDNSLDKESGIHNTKSQTNRVSVNDVSAMCAKTEHGHIDRQMSM